MEYSIRNGENLGIDFLVVKCVSLFAVTVDGLDIELHLYQLILLQISPIFLIHIRLLELLEKQIDGIF